MWTRRTFIFLLLLVMVAISGPTQAEASSDLLLTIGKGQRGDVAFEFKVIQTSSGLLKGEFYAENPGLWTIDTTVNCVEFIGNIAILGGTDDDSGFGNFTAMVSDTPYPDGITIGSNRPPCDITGFGFPPIPITEGQIVVTNPDFYAGN